MRVRTIHRSRRPAGRRAAMAAVVLTEALENRVLLSGYSFSAIGTFGSSFGEPMQSLVADSSGNLYGTATSGGTNLTGGIFKLGKGSSTPTLLVSFATEFSSSGLTIDSNGNLYGLGYTLPSGSNTEDLEVFELPSGGSSLQVLADLGDNGLPEFPASLLRDSSGNLYGTTLNGGTNREGEIFEVVNGSGTATVLASFPNTGSGGIPGDESPNENLLMDSNGDLFGTTSGAGSFGTGDGTIFELPKNSSTITNIYTFDGSLGSAPTGMIMDAHGDFFGNLMDNNSYQPTTIGGIFELPVGATTPIDLASFTAATGFNSTFPLTIDSSGNLFGAAENGGTTTSNAPNGLGVVFELPAGSHTVVPVHAFSGGSDGQIPFGGVSVDSSGNLYGTSIGPGQQGKGLIFKLSPGGSSGGGTGALSVTLTGPLPTASLVSGQKANVSQKLTLTNTGTGLLTGSASAIFVLSSDGSVDSNSITLPVTAAKTLHLKPGKSINYAFHLKSIAASTPAGIYHIFAEVTSPSASVIDALSVSTLTVVPPTIDLSGAFVKSSKTVKNGKPLALTFTLTNTGNVPATGSLPIQIDLSTDDADDQNLHLPQIAHNVVVKPGKTIHLTVKGNTLAVPDGSYFIFVQVDPGNTLHDINPANNNFSSPTAAVMVTGLP